MVQRLSASQTPSHSQPTPPIPRQPPSLPCSLHAPRVFLCVVLQDSSVPSRRHIMDVPARFSTSPSSHRLHVVHICIRWHSMLPLERHFSFIHQNAKLSDSIKGRCRAVRGLCFYVTCLKSGIISTGNGTAGVWGERDLKVK